MAEVELVPMDQKQFSAYLEKAIERYAAENVKAGYHTVKEAIEKSKEDHLRLLPEGNVTPDNHLLIVRDKLTGAIIGSVWLRMKYGAQPSGFLFDIFLEERFRGQGLGASVMMELERLAVKMGARSLFLHVFAHNPAAINLYKKLGYEMKSMNMGRSLE